MPSRFQPPAASIGKCASTPASAVPSILAVVLRNRWLFHRRLKTAKFSSWPCHAAEVGQPVSVVVEQTGIGSDLPPKHLVAQPRVFIRTSIPRMAWGIPLQRSGQQTPCSVWYEQPADQIGPSQCPAYNQRLRPADGAVYRRPTDSTPASATITPQMRDSRSAAAPQNSSEMCQRSRAQEPTSTLE